MTMSSIYKTEGGRDAVLTRYRSILEQWPVEKTEHHVETDFGSTFVIECGRSDAPPLILLHGSVSNSFAWMGEVDKLTQSHRVFAIDLIGEAGFSAPNRPSYESGAYPKWLEEILDRLELGRVSIVGMSLGGWMALSFATNHPDRVSHLSLLCPGGVVRESGSFLFKALFYMLLGEWGKTRIFKLVNGGRLPNSSGMEDAYEFMSLINEHFKPRTAKLSLFTDEALERLTMPVQVIFGENDALIPPKGTIDRLSEFVMKLDAHLLPEIGHVVVGQSERIAGFLLKR